MDIHDKKLHTDRWFTYLQFQICKEFEEIEKEVNGTNRFVTKSWNKKKNSEGGGADKILRNGKVFDKVGVNKSTVSGKFKRDFRKNIPGSNTMLPYVVCMDSKPIDTP